MKVKITKNISVEIDRSLGYPMVFMEYPMKDKDFLEKVKDNLFIEFVQEERNPRYQHQNSWLPLVGKEIVLMANKIDNGFLPVDLGFTPKYVTFLNSAMRAEDHRKWTDFLNIKVQIQSSIADAVYRGEEGFIQMDVPTAEVAAEVTNELGYPMIFVKVDSLVPEKEWPGIQKRIKRSIRKNFSSNAEVSKYAERNAAKYIAAIKEADMMLEWAEEGYLPYIDAAFPPEALGCGPKMSNQGLACIHDADKDFDEEFRTLCMAIQPELKRLMSEQNPVVEQDNSIATIEFDRGATGKPEMFYVLKTPIYLGQTIRRVLLDVPDPAGQEAVMPHLCKLDQMRLEALKGHIKSLWKAYDENPSVCSLTICIAELAEEKPKN